MAVLFILTNYLCYHAVSSVAESDTHTSASGEEGSEPELLGGDATEAPTSTSSTTYCAAEGRSGRPVLP